MPRFPAPRFSAFRFSAHFKIVPALLASLAAAATLALPAPAQSIATNSPVPLSTRVTSYNIDAHINTDKKSLDATEVLTYKNLTGQPITAIPFHLYLNAFRPQSSFTSETHFTGGIRDNERNDEYPDEKLGSITVSKISADGFGDLTGAMHFTAPDDGNMQDHTVAEIPLPHPLAPGDTITFRLAFHDQFPLSIARNGWKRDFIMGGQWYPKPGLFWHGAWNCHQYHSTTEFFSDFGTFTVHLTVPQRYVVGASGVPTGEQANADGTKTLSFYGEDIGDFAWAASPHFTVTDGIYASSMGPVKVHVLALAAHPQAGPRYRDIILKTLTEFDRRYGPYPYKIVTVIDPEPGSEMGGMEYPTLFTGGTSWYEPTHITEVTAEHEFGHQYWYGMVATNEFEDAWLDEGINSYTEVNVLSSILGRETSVFGRAYANAGDYQLQRLSYSSADDLDPVTRWAFKFRNSASYGGVTYGKSATLLATLESVVGRDTMDEAMRTYFMKFRFTHPTTEDFLRTIEAVAVARGRATVLPQPVPCAGVTGCIADVPPVNSSLRPYFDQAVYGTQVLDYSVDSVDSSAVEWWKPEPKDKDEAKKVAYRNTIYLRRKGDFVLPVTVEVIFDDGTKLREHWDGVDRWTKLTYVRNAKVVSAEIDPDHAILLDVDFYNNSYTTAANSVPAGKMSNIWASMQQLLAQAAAWIV
jgi:hypothetical protein